MKILIAGKSSYIGTAIEKWLSRRGNNYYLDKITLKNDLWKQNDFSQYNVVVCLAAMVHIKEKRENQYLYTRVNTKLPYELAQKARAEKVDQFVFLSTMGVYGEDGNVCNQCEITEASRYKPKSMYEVSKFDAEQALLSLQTESFKVAIVRAPFIYGPGCPGNYARLRKAALHLPFFPYYKNQRSMLFIENCCEFVRLLLDSEKGGLFFPQDREFVCTSEMIKQISQENGRNIFMLKGLEWVIRLFRSRPILKKVFGNLTYKKTLSKHFDYKYQVVNVNEAIRITEQKWNDYL